MIAALAFLVGLAILVSAGLGRLETRLRGDMASLRGEFRGDMASLQADFRTLRSEFGQLRDDLTDFRTDVHFLSERMARIEGVVMSNAGESVPMGGRSDDNDTRPTGSAAPIDPSP